jgi:hypothetical protein
VAPAPGPSGARFYLSHEAIGIGEVTDVNLNRLGTFAIHSPEDHASLGRLANGHDVLFTVQCDDPIVGDLIACDMTDLSVPLRKIISQDNRYPRLDGRLNRRAATSLRINKTQSGYTKTSQVKKK